MGARLGTAGAGWMDGWCPGAPWLAPWLPSCMAGAPNRATQPRVLGPSFCTRCCCAPHSVLHARLPLLCSPRPLHHHHHHHHHHHPHPHPHPHPQACGALRTSSQRNGSGALCPAAWVSAVFLIFLTRTRSGPSLPLVPFQQSTTCLSRMPHHASAGHVIFYLLYHALLRSLLSAGHCCCPTSCLSTLLPIANAYPPALASTFPLLLPPTHPSTPHPPHTHTRTHTHPHTHTHTHTHTPHTHAHFTS